MDKWIILHANTRLSQVLAEMLGNKVLRLDLNTLINETQIRVCLRSLSHHQWIVNGCTIDNFHERVIYHEIFYHIDQALDQYFKKDHYYVQNSWQAYLLSLFSHTRFVLNPVTPQSLSVSNYQFPRLLAVGEVCGFNVPSYTVGCLEKMGFIETNSLWFSPNFRQGGKGILNISLEGYEWVIVKFVRYDREYITCWPSIPPSIEHSLLKSCNALDIHMGEAYFRVGSNWWYYGLRPKISANSICDKELEEIALCIKDVGNSGLL